MVITGRLETLLEKRISGPRLGRVQNLLSRLTTSLAEGICPLRKINEVSTQEVCEALRRSTNMPVGLIHCISLACPLPHLPWLSREQFADLSRSCLSEGIGGSIGRSLGDCLGATYWPQLKGSLRDDEENALKYGILDAYGDAFRSGLGILSRQPQWLAPDTTWSPETIGDHLWDSFCITLFYCLGLAIAGQEVQVSRLEPLVSRLPWLIPLGTHVDNEQDWLIPCQ